MELPRKWRRGGREPLGASVPEGFLRGALESLPRDLGSRNQPWLTEPAPIAQERWVGRSGRREQGGGGKWLSLLLQDSGAGGGRSGDWVQRKLPDGAGMGAAAWPQLARVSAASPSRKRMGWPGGSQTRFFMILCMRTAPNPTALLPLGWGCGVGGGGPFLTHCIKWLGPNSPTRGRQRLSVDAGMDCGAAGE